MVKKLCVLIGDVKMNKRMFTKKFFSLDFSEKIHNRVNKFFFEKN